MEGSISFDLREAEENGRTRNFVLCPFCGQKMFNVVSLGGETEVIVKCRRCRRYIRVRMAP